LAKRRITRKKVRVADQEILAIDDRIRKLPLGLADGQKEAADAAKKFEDQLSKIEDQGREYRQKSIIEELKRVDELAKGWNSAFDSLYQRANADNPFAAFLQKSATEAEKLKTQIAGLPPELQKTAVAMQAIATSKDLFKLSLDNALSSLNLRSDAARFTDPTQSELQRKLNADYANFRRTSNSTNPDVLNDFQRRQKQINDYDKDRTNNFRRRRV
jgi:DNA repair ATPase RecN